MNCRSQALLAGSVDHRVSLPQIKEFVIAGGGDLQFLLLGGAQDGGSDVRYGSLKTGQGNPDRASVRELFEILQDLDDQLMVFPLAAVRQIILRHGLEVSAGLAVVS